jgi:hypothetical protein
MNSLLSKSFLLRVSFFAISLVVLSVVVFSDTGSFASNIELGEVIAVRPLTLKEDVDPLEFEKFIAETPELTNFLPGVRVFFMKADRGKNIGQYAAIWLIDSFQTRKMYWPQAGADDSAAAQGLFNVRNEAVTKSWEKLNEYLTGDENIYTDYVTIQAPVVLQKPAK